MQLFSIGLVMLNADGTPLLDANGKQVTTYDNDDIMDFSRVWTGFDEQPKRANIEDGGGENDVDPMQIKPAWRGASSVTDPYATSPALALALAPPTCGATLRSTLLSGRGVGSAEACLGHV